MSTLTLWILNNPTDGCLRLLAQLPDSTHIVAGDNAEAFENVPDPDVTVVGIGKGKLLQQLWPRISQAKWMHSLTAGLESVLFPALVESDLPMSNAKGVFARSLGEFAISACLYFAKDFRRMVRSQEAGVWDSFDVEELTGKTFGIVGYGGIGRESARRAQAMGMRVVALRRHPDQSHGDPYVDQVYPPAAIVEMLSQCDYVVVAAPNTPETRGLIGARELAAMKPDAVLINVGRGPVIDEPALIAALTAKRIKGAALDVFNVEPLPEGHAFFQLDNVLLSPHCADHTPGWLDESMQFFVSNFLRFVEGQPLENLVNKKLGY